MSFRRKIIFISIVIGLIPVVVLGMYSYQQTKKLLIDREITALRESLSQETRNIEHKILTYTNALNYIAWNISIQAALEKKYTNNYDMYIAYRDTIDNPILVTRTLNTSIESITIFTDATLNPHGNIVRPLSDISQLSWYKPTIGSPFLVINEEQVLLIGKLFSKTTENIIVLFVNHNDLFSELNHIFDNEYGVAIFNEDKKIYEFGEFNSFEEYSRNDEKYVTGTVEINNTGWHALIYRPISAISKPVTDISFAILLVILEIIAVILPISFILARIITTPLESLAKNMKLVEEGEFTIAVKYSSQNEIGKVITTFEKMVERLKYMIEEVLKSKIQKQEYEMKALQAQINPHFLYNTLSMINNRAIITGQDDISQVAQHLSNFYRTTLNKGKSLITVEEELQNTISYAKLQQLMHSDSFDIIYDIDESAYQYLMPNLLLQPLVENAYIHGISHKEIAGRAFIKISCHIEYQTLIFEVSDNGKGMTSCDEILSLESSGYGVKNINSRVHLLYGEEYGLKYISQENVGTTATLTIPFNKRTTP